MIQAPVLDTGGTENFFLTSKRKTASGPVISYPVVSAPVLLERRWRAV